MPSQLAAGTLSPSTFSPSTFSGQHILLTAVIAAALTLGAALALRVRGVDLLAVTALTFAASWLLRRAANMPQLNNDGLAPFSANDVLSPAVTWVAIAIYSDLRPGPISMPLRRARAVAALFAFAVNVTTI